ncbi:hypothetical protein EJ06DRAFT_485117 [Trichodelitschia bisporula]|uniref:Azaphilone pigments biosynthesis cluster protein L N-terminal domain-containing protein n=1 Tax=Trichodelitschia bisporula TaxID=703511 RepID=A0A6G1HHY2_9PEZI|nr:hypothetical protein EJ06DRAFT_485117 [Trichodelitschia bisporula]
MDPLSIAASTLGIAQVVVISIVKLHDFINELAEADEELKNIASNIAGIHLALTALGELDISTERTRAVLKKAGVAEAVSKCGALCDKFTKSLERWTKHSSGNKLSFRDRLLVGMWHSEKIRTFKMRVQSCKDTVHFAVSCTQLIISLDDEHSSEDRRKELEIRARKVREEVKEHVDLSKTQQLEAQQRKKELEKESDSETEEAFQLRESAIEEVEKQLRLLRVDQESSEAVLSQLPSESVEQEIRDIRTAENSWAAVGSSASVVGITRQRIEGVHTTNQSVAVVGRFDVTSIPGPMSR